MTHPESARTTYSVSELAGTARELLEHSFPLLWVEGEISNLARPRSGHWYFTLKDSKAQIRCAMFANRNRQVRQPPTEGDQILVRARVSLYTARGDFQLIVESMEDAGEGALRRAFEQLRARLTDEGLFNDTHKQPLPVTPQRIGVITSATGAALRDVYSVLQRRYPLGELLLHPVQVQGEAAPAAIVQAIETVGVRAECDVVLLVRGGGSLEDLQAFNNESVARAIHACPLPIVAGVGHEVDISIADFVADVRAPTPSAAAELACPDLQDRLRHAERLSRRTANALTRRLTEVRRGLGTLNGRLTRAHPQRQIERRMQRLDELETRIRRNTRQHLDSHRMRLRAAINTLKAQHPQRRLTQDMQKLAHSTQRLDTAIKQRIQTANHRYRLAAASLNTVSPLRTLARGYAIVEDSEQRVVTNPETLAVGDKLGIRVEKGHVEARVSNSHVESHGNHDNLSSE